MTNRFEEESILRLAGHLQALLEGMLAHPQQRLAELPCLTEAERQQLLYWNPFTSYAQTSSLTALFEAQVERAPDTIALVYDDQQISYGALNARANQLARHLQQLGVGTETLVGLCLERSLDMLVGILGILKARRLVPSIPLTHQLALPSCSPTPRYQRFPHAVTSLR